ncbi:MAG: hypothetical protein ACE5JF_07105 [Anaerolineales bacterium]
MAVNTACTIAGVRSGKRQCLLRVKAGQIVSRFRLDMARGAEGIVRLEPSSNCVGASGKEKADDPYDSGDPDMAHAYGAKERFQL